MKTCLHYSASLSFAVISLITGNSDARSALGESCAVYMGSNTKYFEGALGYQKCEASLVCITEVDDGQLNVDFPGTCELESCYGTLTGSGNVGGTTGKVTICHRTCSETNPWIRITIDASAWSNAECKHGQHDVSNCNGKNHTLWGEHQSDYILKEHGSKDQVAASLGFSNSAISAYWNHWESACPAVQNGQCCDFDGQYGYTCCPGGSDPTPEEIAQAPVSTSIIQAPVSIPITQAPVSIPTNQAPVSIPITQAPVSIPITQAPVSTPITQAPVTVPVLTPAPVAVVATPVPAATATQSPVAADPADPSSDCRRRQLGTLEEKWAINTQPTFNYTALTFTLDFEIGDGVVDQGQVRYTLYDATCTTPYTGLALNGTVQSLYDGGVVGDEKQNAPVKISIDSSEISRDTQVYSENKPSNGPVTADVDFCLRFSLHTPAAANAVDIEVNFLEVVILLDVSLTDGFQIADITVTPFDRCNLQANDSFEVEGYICETGKEAENINLPPTLTQGQVVKICVRPTQEARDLNIRMRNIQNFTFTTIDGLEQQAIVDSQADSNGLTQLWCEAGYAICHFDTILNAAFFAKPGVVSGYGVADMQFGGESSGSSVAPGQRRRTMRSGLLGLEKRGVGLPTISARRLQATEAAGSGEFGMDFQTQEVSNNYSGGPVTATTVASWVILLVGTLSATMLW